MSGTRYTDAGITPVIEAYVAVEMLSYAAHTVVLDKFGMNQTMPKNKTQVIKWRRPITFDPATTPLSEGVTPNLTQFGYETVTGTLKQYGQVVEITDIIEDFALDQVAKDAYQQCSDNIYRTQEALDWATLRAGTSVSYANGSSRAAVNSVLSLDKIRAVVRGLRRNKAKMITTALASSPNFATRAVEPAWVAIGHTDLEPDIRNLPGFIPCASYGSKKMICEQEIGSVENVRFVLSEDLEPFADAGGTAATNGTKTTSGTAADVYPLLFLGKEAYGRVALRGAGAVSPAIVPVNQRDKSDPLGQRGFIGWKMYHLTVILNQLWMTRLEVATTAL